MSEEKKIIELKEEELEKVNGGFEKEMVECLVLKAGDCFKNSALKIKVKHDYIVPIDIPQDIEIELTIIASGITCGSSLTSNNSIFDINFFAGNNAW